ncbi:MAG: hypothetical protein J0I34_32490 [Pseudonocardia sp.]|uniref:hypothetical protein n=1 Tax=unclassified Pseudonocardia TaxID=2619320 RepID=UPI00086C8CCC|nr:MULTISPECIES: hypothetical protein [unclassified Pseudonocardia]MBN9113489.1 hypothetical protein [Pseudonocardia sp.]ODV01868.1 MAG: hypothetical protein ABT15_26750 [Pseudonocardia sp. SCN 73-27]
MTGAYGGVISPAADASARDRWRALALTDPVSRLVRNAAHAGIDDADYDLRLLALAAVDVVVGSMGFAREATLDDVVDELTGLASRMCPGRPDQARDAAQTVVRGLLNDAHDQRRFSYRFADLGAPGETVRWESYSFRLLSLREAEYGPVVVASDQAVTLFLNGLDVDLEDADRALAHVLQRQLDDRRFDAAARTAAQAERTSVGMSATLAELLDATRRDVGSHDWEQEVPERLVRARRHVEARIGEDDRLLEHVQSGLDAETSPEVRAVSGRIVDLIGRARRVHLDLERRLVGAREVFLTAQVRQRLARRRRLRMLALRDEVLVPVLALPRPVAVAVTTAFADRALGVSVPRLVRFDDMVDMLWAPPRARESAEPDVEIVPDVDEAHDVQRYPEPVVGAAREVLSAVTGGEEIRLSALLDAVPDAASVDAEIDEGEVAELVLLSALWAFAPDVVAEAEGDVAGEIDVLAGGIEARRDDRLLARSGVGGPDLLVRLRGGRVVEAADPLDDESEPVA